MSRSDRPLFALDRRTLLKGALGAGLTAGGWPLLCAGPARAQFKAFPFSLGVASGEPAPDGFVIWTRLAPEPLTPSGGMPPAPAEVTWEVAADQGMQRVLRSGKASARAEAAHSVHVEVEGLEPGRDYFYRFRAGGAESPVGRSRTLPAPGAAVSQLRFASAGCQKWADGYYTAWRRIAEENFDFVAHYGDYIYEGAAVIVDERGRPLPRVMPKDFGTCRTLADYRRRYALYKSDADLQAAHASCAFLSSFDDHEVADNWAADSDSKHAPRAEFLSRRAAAFQAWYEHIPLRRKTLPRGADILAYRAFRFGNLADMAVLDTRQFRSKAACGAIYSSCSQAQEKDRTMLGDRQERWLADVLRSASGTWQILAQQVLFSRLDWRFFTGHGGAELELRMDAWDGASAGRNRVLKMLQETRSANPVVLTGDLHRGMAMEISANPDDPGGPCVGVEFLATSISSDGDGSRNVRNAEAIFRQNPHLKFLNVERGYTRHVVTPARWQADFRAVQKVSTPGAPILTRKSFVVEAGRPGLVDV